MSAHTQQAELLTTKETADLLKISKRTLSRMVATGSFPKPYRYSRKLVRYHRADVSAFLANIKNK